jgi:protein-disulfide isomerase
MRKRRQLSKIIIEAGVQKVEDIQSILAYGVMSTPALVVDEQVKSIGRVPSVDAIKQLLK